MNKLHLTVSNVVRLGLGQLLGKLEEVCTRSREMRLDAPAVVQRRRDGNTEDVSETGWKLPHALTAGSHAGFFLVRYAVRVPREGMVVLCIVIYGSELQCFHHSLGAVGSFAGSAGFSCY